MQPIAQRLAEIARNIEIVGADPATRYGFTQVPNFVLTNIEEYASTNTHIEKYSARKIRK